MNKRLFCGLFLVFSAVLIVRPVIGSVNIEAGDLNFPAATARLDGDPMPPPGGPHHSGALVLIADGDPMPPPGGPHVVDGDPMPPPSGPHKPGAITLIADGDPMPPPGGPHARA